MDEKEIRKILTSYLKANNSKVRIFKEKSIGGSICDLMAVTDIISGYEIKSDLDNYSRLGTQVINYNKFFNKNYIVVDPTPENWKNQVEIVMKGVAPKQNKLVMLRAWNEWGEGNYMEPDLKYGRSFIEVLKNCVEKK